MLADRIGAHDGEPVRGHHPARRAQGAGPGGHHDPAGHRLRAVPLGRRQPADHRRPRPGQPDAGVQGLRLRGARHDQPTQYGRRGRRHGRGPAGRRARRGRPTGHPARRRAAPAVQPDPALRPARGHPRPRRARAAAARRRRPAPRRPGRRRAPGGAGGRARRPRSGAVRRARPGHRQHPDPAADPWPGPRRRPAGRTGARVPVARGLPAARPRGAGTHAPRWWSAAGCSACRWRGRWPARASRSRSSRAASTCCAARSTPRPARSWPATCAGSGPVVYTGARATRLTDDGLVLDNGVRAPDRPGRAHRRRSAVHRAGPPGRARRTPRGGRRPPPAHQRPARARHRRLRPAPRPGHRVRAAGVGAGRPAGRAPDRCGRHLRRGPHGGPAARHRPRRGRARRPRARRGPGRRGDQPGRRLAPQAGRPRRGDRGRDAGR